MYLYILGMTILGRLWRACQVKVKCSFMIPDHPVTSTSLGTQVHDVVKWVCFEACIFHDFNMLYESVV